jgi:hypothetical protein
LAVARDVERCREPRQVAQACDPGHGGTGLRVGGEVEVSALLGHVFDRNRNLPRDGTWDSLGDLPRRGRRLVVFTHP